MDTESISLIAQHTKAIKEKLRALKGTRFETQRVMSEVLKPVTTPLKALAKSGERKSEEKQVEGENDDDEEDSDGVFSYLQKLRAAEKGELDSTYGVRYEDGEYRLGRKRIQFNENVIRVGEDSYDATQGLYELIFKRVPNRTIYTNEDLDVYGDIISKTLVHKVGFAASGRTKSSRGYKYKNIIRPFVSTSIGSGLEWKLHATDSNSDYIYWTDPNVLVHRLRLLTASRNAGNDNHLNEIYEIISELKSNKIIANDD